ncbi:cytochrome P450 [Dichotomopilus funicola]|uniref:Cytochrome P450 n=1 Tax=Dichotomopilus funicola TaxID=1934379 RepID=A0AAN6ZLA5_9PEZI|nr:cytochrome P450 [Dichotomopilus funicola]
MSLMSLSYGQVALVALGLYAFYIAARCIYLLFFHPLRHIPGPKLVAVTEWVEIYYQCFKGPGGQFFKEYTKWHDKYGPIIRIAPNEVHIRDPTFYDVLYSQSRHVDKLKHLADRFNNEMSGFATPEHNVHRMRRSAINPFFSKRRIAQYSPNIQRRMDTLIDRVKAEYVGNGRILNLSDMWAAFAGDVVVDYTFEKPYDFIHAPDFRAAFSDATIALMDPLHWITFFPWPFRIAKMLPDRLVKALSPTMGAVIDYQDEMKDQIIRAKAVHAHATNEKAAFPDSPNNTQQQSLFTALLESGLPPAELSTKRLQQEALTITTGGMETTMYTFSRCCYYVLSNPAILSKLRAELFTAIPDPTTQGEQITMPPLETLEQLPYLTCVVTESLRFTYGIVGRFPRLSPTPMIYQDRRPGIATSSSKAYTIPVGCIVSMDNFGVSHDPWLFPEPFTFRPERWEASGADEKDGPRAPDGKPLRSYIVSFGKGTRSCAGRELAYADLYIGLANFFRRFECELFETGREEVEVVRDCFVARPAVGAKGVRAKVLGVI